MQQPRSIKDIQKLAGKIAAMNRFVSKKADKCLPFFKILRNASRFSWDGNPPKLKWKLLYKTNLLSFNPKPSHP